MLVVVEGFDGSGKDTAINKIVSILEEYGIKTHVFQEPGSTVNGTILRGIVKNTPNLSSFQQFMLFNASREELYRTKIKPLLKEGEVVITNRGILSTEAYQTLDLSTSRLSRANWLDICKEATHGCEADFVVFMDTPFGTCLDSIDARSTKPDAIESQDISRLKVIYDRMRIRLRTVYPKAPLCLVDREAKTSIDEVCKLLINMHEEH